MDPVAEAFKAFVLHQPRLRKVQMRYRAAIC